MECIEIVPVQLASSLKVTFRKDNWLLSVRFTKSLSILLQGHSVFPIIFQPIKCKWNEHDHHCWLEYGTGTRIVREASLLNAM